MDSYVYADNAATSFPKAEGLSGYLKEYTEKYCVNINRGVYSLSFDNERIVDRTRERLVELFDYGCVEKAPEKYAVFTPGVTFSLNLFLRGYLKKDDHILVSPVEHHAVMRTLYDLKEKRGVSFSIIPADDYGIIKTECIEGLIRDNTRAILVNHASNVFGGINDIEIIGHAAKKHGLVFAVDCAQTGGFSDISMKKAGIDFLAFSAHKGLLALQGLGGFIISDTLAKSIPPLVTGGSGSFSDSYIQPSVMPEKFEAGTLNLPGIASLDYSLDYLKKKGIRNIKKHELDLRRRFIDGIKENRNLKVYNADIDDSRTTAVVSVSFHNIDNARAAFMLSEKYSILTRVGLHCAYLAHKTMKSESTGTVRFSFGPYNTKDDIERCITAVNEISLAD